MPVSTFWEWLIHFSSHIETLVLESAGSPWIYVGIFAVSLVDAIFPVVPSESVVIAASVTAASQGNPMLIFVFLVAAAGAWCGDQITYLVGTKIDIRRFSFLQRERWRKSLNWAESMLERRGSTFIIAARFIPLGRAVVNLTAGVLRFPHRRFMAVDAVAVVIWAAWGIGLGTVAASVFKDNLLLSIVVGIIGGTVMGLFVDKILTKLGFGPPDLPRPTDQVES